MSSNTAENQTIVPDMPVMRSIRIGAAPSAVPMMPLRTTAKAHFGTAKPALQVVSSSWRLESDLPQLSESYPLERCHLSIEGVEAQQVATRISNALREASISAEFQKSTATATTMEHVTFAINLFQSGCAVVVECQRLSGCSYSYCQNAKLVLKSAKGERHRMVTTPPCPNMAAIAGHQADQDEAVRIAVNLLNDERIDAQQMGMESLVHLSGDRTFRLDQTPCELVLRQITAESADPVRHSALHVLGNVLDNSALEQRFLTDELLAGLVSDLEKANSNPHNAHLACKCLMHFERRRVTKFTNVILAASQNGRHSHALLEQSSDSLCREIGC